MKNDPGKSIFIVEDDISSQQYYTIVLDGLYELQIVPTASDARALLKEHDYVIAIIDLSLPGDVDGIALIKYIRNEISQNLPILAITAHAFSQSRTAAIKAGATEYFTKPILSTDLIDAMKRVQS